MPIRDILQLGNPALNRNCAPVKRAELSAAIATGRDLHDTLLDFRARHGWGRAIAAPQIGVLKRIVYLLVEGPFLIFNPVITSPSRKTMEIWDDCMSFPDLLVRVRRHCSFVMTFRDENWAEHSQQIEGQTSELLQHEIDHVDGVLAVSRAINGASFALQSERHLLMGAAFANKPKKDAPPP
jgi:peptide deformylase